MATLALTVVELYLNEPTSSQGLFSVCGPYNNKIAQQRAESC
jgi:hypothetical protein